MNALRSSGKPLFFRIANAPELGIGPPAARRDVAVRVFARALGGMQKEAFVVSRGTAAAWRLASDEGSYLNGDDEAPCPLAFLTTGMICSFYEEILALARLRGIPIGGLELRQDNYYTMRGSALLGTMVGGARDVELEARVASEADGDALLRLLSDAAVASPVHGLLHGELESRFALSHNGHAVACDRVRALPADCLAAPTDDLFAAAAAAAQDPPTLIERGGPSPKTDENTSFRGSSLAEHQDRVLHVHAICRLRPDGLKQVEQHLLNPHGSIFRFLCEEAPASGIGRAPDAASYVSAGIAFCFMTQLGRYASIAKKSFADYRIVQDTQFSLGGASGGSGAAGEADPVETHVSLRSGEDDDFARKALDMSEQTCFLHALCRTNLRTRIRLGRLP